MGTCAAMGDGFITVAAFVRRLPPESTELYARGVHDEVVRGITLRTLLHGAVGADFLRQIDATPALGSRVRAGTVTFDDYAHSRACIPAELFTPLNYCYSRLPYALSRHSPHSCPPGSPGC